MWKGSKGHLIQPSAQVEDSLALYSTQLIYAEYSIYHKQTVCPVLVALGDTSQVSHDTFCKTRQGVCVGGERKSQANTTYKKHYGH